MSEPPRLIRSAIDYLAFFAISMSLLASLVAPISWDGYGATLARYESVLFVSAGGIVGIARPVWRLIASHLGRTRLNGS